MSKKKPEGYVDSVIIRNLSDNDNGMLEKIKYKFNQKTNSKALINAGWQCLWLKEENERLAKVSVKYYKLVEECKKMVELQDTTERIKEIITKVT